MSRSDRIPTRSTLMKTDVDDSEILFHDSSDYIESYCELSCSTGTRSSRDSVMSDPGVDQQISDQIMICTEDDHMNFTEEHFYLSKAPIPLSPPPEPHPDDDGLEVTVEEVQALFALEEMTRPCTGTASAETSGERSEGSMDSGGMMKAGMPSISAQEVSGSGRKLTPEHMPGVVNLRKTTADDSDSSKRAPAAKPKVTTHFKLRLRLDSNWVVKIVIQKEIFV